VRPSLAIGSRVGAYRVIRAIGRGGMAGVFEVEDPEGQRFALKSPITDVRSSSDVARRFARETNAMRVLNHPNLVSAVDVFVDSGVLFLVMEMIVGRTLTTAISDGLPPRAALLLARQILEGMGHAHAAGVIHRDLKPDNIVLVADQGWERVKILDFGLVKLIGDAAGVYGSSTLTNAGVVHGTPAYMAPEQARGGAVDARSDLYSIGIILFEMLIGRLPFVEQDARHLMARQVASEVPTLDVASRGAAWATADMVALVEGAVTKDPAVRFISAQVMLGALDDAYLSLG
jgi:serine/threonine protein kinase